MHDAPMAGGTYKPTAEEKERQALESAMYLRNDIQRMCLLDAKRFKGQKKALMMLKEARSLLDKLIGGDEEGDEEPKKKGGFIYQS